MAIGNIYGKTNIPANLIKYTGINSETADIHIDNYNYTFEVDVKKVPNDLIFAVNDLESSEIIYNGSEAVGIDLTPITLNPEGYENYKEEDVKKIFRKPTSGSYMEAPYVVTYETKEEISADVNIAVSNNTEILIQETLFASFDSSLKTLVNSVELVKIFGNKYEEDTGNDADGDGITDKVVTLNAIRLGSNSETGLGTLTLHLNWSVSKIGVTASKYYTDKGSVDSNALLYINGVQVDIKDKLEKFEVNLPTATSTLVFENRRSSGKSKGRAFITNISTVKGGNVFTEKQLAYKDYVDQSFVSNGDGRAYTLELFASDDDPLTYSQFDLYSASLLKVIDKQGRDYRLSIELPEESQDTNISWHLPFKSGTLATLDDCSLEVLKNVVIDSSNNPSVITFPENILPIRFYWDDYGYTFYFNYYTLKVLDSGGYTVGSITYENKRVVARIDGTKGYGAYPENDQLTYWLIDGSNFETIELNTYNLYYQNIDATLSSTSENPVQNKVITNAIDTLKRGSYTKVNITEYPTLQDFLATTGEEGFLYLYPVNTSNEDEGYYQYIWENNLWIPLGTTKIDIANMVTTDTQQTITGQKTFTTKIFVNSISSTNYGENLELFTVEQLKLYGGSYGIETKGSITPVENGKDSLGGFAAQWKDGWIKNLKGTTTMTQAQYDALATKDADTLYFIEEE